MNNGNEIINTPELAREASELLIAQLNEGKDITSDRNATIKAIKTALQRRSGKAWSVTGGRGTAWGWIRIDAPPARQTWKHVPKPHNASGFYPGKENWDEIDTGEPGHSTGPQDREELAKLLGIEVAQANGGVSIPSQGNYRREYLDRAEGKKPSVLGEMYWD